MSLLEGLGESELSSPGEAKLLVEGGATQKAVGDLLKGGAVERFARNKNSLKGLQPRGAGGINLDFRTQSPADMANNVVGTILTRAQRESRQRLVCRECQFCPIEEAVDFVLGGQADEGWVLGSVLPI